MAGLGIAIVGMSGRFPGAHDIESLWNNLRMGVESIRQLAPAEIEPCPFGITDKTLKDFVPRAATLDNVDAFDAEFFGFTPREAELMDPQQRLFLECAYEALETAGYSAEQFPGAIGVYAATTMSRYLFQCIARRDVLKSSGMDQIAMGNNIDFLAPMVSYKLNLTGPSCTVQTACSSSLVCVHLACQALLNGECDLALAGGSAIRLPQSTGYVFQEGGIQSPDGHCRPFDAQANGTVFGNGVATIVLQRLEDAIAEKSHILAVILGTAVNNDGSTKVGFTAPSVTRQAAAICEALSVADVAAHTISYVEAHGTGTASGDPVELRALTQAFRHDTSRKCFCALGSLKANIGHLDAAAGITGLIKVVQMLRHRQIPPQVNFHQIHPEIDLASSPFYVPSKLIHWDTNQEVRRAGVSSLGIGGTNAHAIVQEAPSAIAPVVPDRKWKLLTVSAKSEAALTAARNQLLAHSKLVPQSSLGDVAFTCHVGRAAYAHRQANVVSEWDELHSSGGSWLPSTIVEETPAVAWLFSGQELPRADYLAELYHEEPVFCEAVERCLSSIGTPLSSRLRAVICGGQPVSPSTAEIQPLAFTVQYALAELWRTWGVEPSFLLGHSLGEYAGACVAGVFDVEDAVRMVTARGELMQQMPPGRMLAVLLPELQLMPLVIDEVELAAVNETRQCVLTGSPQAIEIQSARLVAAGVNCVELDACRAFHSRMMEPMMARFAEVVAAVKLRAPRIRLFSGMTGTWHRDEEITSPDYWCRQLRQPVRFASAILELEKAHQGWLLEVGPGRTVGEFARNRARVLSSLPHRSAAIPASRYLQETLGRLWSSGVRIDWSAYHRGREQRRVPLPTYPFQRRRYWIAPSPSAGSQAPATMFSQPEVPRSEAWTARDAHLERWFYVPSWQRSAPARVTPLSRQQARKRGWLFFCNSDELADQLLARMEQEQLHVVVVRSDKKFSQVGPREFTIRAAEPADYVQLLDELACRELSNPHVVHLWNVGSGELSAQASTRDNEITLGFYSLLFLAQSLGNRPAPGRSCITVVTSDAQELTGLETVRPVAAMSQGCCNVFPQEIPHLVCKHVDLPSAAEAAPAEFAELLLTELLAADPQPKVAYRGSQRWIPLYMNTAPDMLPRGPTRVRRGGVYVILGGLGRFGLVAAEYLALTHAAHVVLTSRYPFPPIDQWTEYLQMHAENDRTSIRIRELQRLTAAGGKLRVVTARVEDESALQRAFQELEIDLGPIHGVIHAAGEVGESIHRTAEETNRAETERIFAAKVDGLHVLERVLRKRELDFCLLTSSLSPILGGLGLTAYAAAHCFLDAFVDYVKRSTKTPWISINWEGWQRQIAGEIVGDLGSNLAELLMSDDEIVACLSLVLCFRKLNRVVVATGNLQHRMDRWILPADDRDAREVCAPPAVEDGAPLRDSVENVVLSIAKEILGVHDLQGDDNLFERGGNSLMAIQLLSRLRERFQSNLPLRILFTSSTVAEIARHLDPVNSLAEDPELEQILAEIEQLDETQAREALDRES